METACHYDTAMFNDDTRPFLSMQACYDGCQRASLNWLVCILAPLTQGQLTDRHLSGTPAEAHATKPERVWLTPQDVKANLAKMRKLNEFAADSCLPRRPWLGCCASRRLARL
jgi:aryl-alcohol dehydrogenase-like predicted oxidoreductase